MPKRLELKAGTRNKLEISFELNQNVEYAYVREFIIDALETWGGQKHPSDPLFNSLEKVQVKRIK